MSRNIPVSDIDRRDALERQGLRFRDRDRPYEIFLSFDIPLHIMSGGYPSLLATLLSRIARALRRGKFSYCPEEPSPNGVRVDIDYKTWDLDVIATREEQDMMFILSRVEHLLRARSAWERNVRYWMPLVALPLPFFALTTTQYYDPDYGAPCYFMA